jgi:hypothetical protein
VSVTPSSPPRRWSGAWLDAVAFVAGLAMAWFGEWETKDLVWSLWLSSLVVGYSLIVWNVTGRLREFMGNVLRDRTPGMRVVKTGTLATMVVGALFILGFFTVHYGGFHFGHSLFLATFFPLHDPAPNQGGLFNPELYLEVVRRYWIFVPVAFLAEREAFRGSAERAVAVSATSVTPKPIERRKSIGKDDSMMAPYKNVIRMHLLIFFFAAAHFAKLENFAVYAVVYAVYFFPWRLLRRERSAEVVGKLG